MGCVYFNAEHAIIVHDEIIDISGGRKGLINLGLLQSTLEHVQNQIFYPKFEDKLTHLFFSINKNHIFVDGNKRSSIALSAYFLEINDLGFRITRFITEMENVAVDVAENRIDKTLLFKIVHSIIYTDDYHEELKLEILQAKIS